MKAVDERILCISNPYSKLYYYNEMYKLPAKIKDELKVIAVTFSERNHCIFTMFFDDYNELNFLTQAEDCDFSFDEIGTELDIRKLVKKRSELFNSINLYYRVMVLGDKDFVD